MISIKTNIPQVVSRLLKLGNDLTRKDQLLRAVALTILPVMRDRIHVDGKAADGSQIGTYSPGYMKVRTGDFKNAQRITRGKNKGKIKNAGEFTKGKGFNLIMGFEVAEFRPNYNRSSDTKVILSLTHQMENDFSMQATEGGAYVLGYHNELNAKKAKWAEEKYGSVAAPKKIFSLTKEEKELANKAAQDFIKERLSAIS